MTKPKFCSDDYHSDDTWDNDRGPKHCVFCGYDIRTKLPDGRRAEMLSQTEVMVNNSLHYRWHVDCATRDPRYAEAQRLIKEGFAKACNLLNQE